jgi:hypothetical protein
MFVLLSSAFFVLFFVRFIYLKLFGDRLGTYGLAEYQIEGDGNCQVSMLHS